MRQRKGLIGLLLACLMLVMGPAATASASAEVHLVNAAVGAKTAQVTVAVGGRKVTVVASKSAVPAGAATFTIAGTSVKQTLADGHSYTVVELPKNQLVVFEDGTARPRTARLRVIHAAPELGSPDIQLDKRTIAEGLKYRQATPYMTVDAGSYTLAVTKPGSTGGKPIFQQRISLAAGTATSATLAGSGGAQEKLIVTNDDTVTPTGAPHTGLGALAHGRGAPWLLAALAALLAGGLGGALHRRRAG